MKKTPIAVLALLAPMILAAGCDWLSPSGSKSRSSPVLGELSVAPRSAFCGVRNKLTISFGYSDPQDDILQVLLTFEHTRLTERITRTVAWTEMDLGTSPGRAIYSDFYFECGGPSAGVWRLTARAEDERGHLSNEPSTEVNLVSSR